MKEKVFQALSIEMIIHHKKNEGNIVYSHIFFFTCKFVFEESKCYFLVDLVVVLLKKLSL